MSMFKSKQRVADHGEVFTPAWMVEAMLDLVRWKAGTVKVQCKCGKVTKTIGLMQSLCWSFLSC